MDKRPIYPGAIPLDLDILQPQRNMEIALGFIMQSAFGTNTVIDGLSVVPTSVASMQVKVGPGCIIVSSTVDTLTSGFGSLPVDNANALVKIGINLTSTTMSALTAPAIAGQSQNWLVEAQFIETDAAPVVLQYYNADNPNVPYTGPSNAGTPNNTARTNTVQLQWKGGTAATTGTQNTPSPDAGWTGVAIVTVANGQSTITSGNITPYSAAPYVPTKLVNQRTKLLANLNIYVSPSGSDSASGLSASSPFFTLQKCWDTISANYDLNGFTVTVNMANGTYTTGVSATSQIVGIKNGPSAITFLGNVGSPSSVTVSTAGDCFAASFGAELTVSGMTKTSSGGNALKVNQNGNITVGASCVFGACTSGSHMYSTNGSAIIITANYSITGGAQSHWNVSGTSNITCQGFTITLTGTPAISGFFAAASLASSMSVQSNTFSGSATGVRYLASSCGVINTNGAGATYLPGSVGGSTATGGQYV